MLGTNKTAILIFANSSLKDELRKGIPHSKALFSALTEHILIKVENTGLPYFIYDEQLQIGSDFGSRFTTAVEAVFNRGFESIITIGNDTPELTSNTILSTFRNLCEGKTVIGPSQDGGVYLLGFHQTNFNAASFRELPWQTRNLLKKITRSFLQKGAIQQLPRLTDIDTLADIETLVNLGGLNSKVLVSILLKMLKTPKLNIAYSFRYFNSIITGRTYNKGSPSFTTFS